MLQARYIAGLLLPATALLLLAPIASQGLEGDRKQPIDIEADRAWLDEKNEISTYEGNVFLRQGSFEMRGDHMTVHISGRQVNRITLKGKPARMQQRRNSESAIQHAEADAIEYSAMDERVVLLGNALVRQNEIEQFSSERIVFNLENSTISAGSEDSTGRVHITLQPKNSSNGSQAETRP